MSISLVTCIIVGLLQSSDGLKAALSNNLKVKAKPEIEPLAREEEKPTSELCDQSCYTTYKSTEFMTPDVIFCVTERSNGMHCKAHPNRSICPGKTAIKQLGCSFSGGNGDPIMSTIAGERFDLRAIGSFNLLTLVEKNSSKEVFRLDASIEQAGVSSGSHARLSRCATYITGISMSGSWTSQNLTLSASSNELQFFLDGVNVSVSDIEKNARLQMHSVTQKKFVFQVADAQAIVSLGQHRQRGTRTSKTWFLFLNLEMTGVSNVLSKGYLTSHGLLGGDDFEFATHPSKKCETESTSSDTKLAQLTTTDPLRTPEFMLSSCDIK